MSLINKTQPLSNQASTVLNRSVNQIDKLENNHITKVCEHINKSIEDPRYSRLFAIVMIGGSQYKVTSEDTIIVRNHFYPTIGDKIRLEKVLLVGSKDFSIIGKPTVSKDLVRVEATVIEKTMSNDIIMFTYQPRKDNRRMRYLKKSFIGCNPLACTEGIEMKDHENNNSLQQYENRIDFKLTVAVGALILDNWVYKGFLTLLRINSIDLIGKVNS